MEKNEYLCNAMTKTEEREFELLTSKLGAEKQERLAEQRKRCQAEERAARSEQEKEALRTRLDDTLAQLTSMMHQMTDFMMGKGAVSLSDTLKDSIVAGVREEFEQQKCEMTASFEKQKQEMISAFTLRLAAKDNEIQRLRDRLSKKDGKNGKGGDKSDNDSAPVTSSPVSSTDADTAQTGSAIAPEDRVKQLEQQRASLQGTAYGQNTESWKWRHQNQQTEDADTLDLNGQDVPAEEVEKIAAAVKAMRGKKSMKGVLKPRRSQPLFDMLDSIMEEDELARPEDERSLIVIRPEGMPDDAYEIGEKVTKQVIWVEGHFRNRKIIRKTYRDPRGNYYEVNMPEHLKNCMGRTEVTESVIAKIITMHFDMGITMGDIESWLQSKGLNYAHATVIGWIDIASRILEPLDEPTRQEITSDLNQHSDETTLKACDRRLPGKGENEEDVEPEEHYFKRWLFCHYSPTNRLVQFDFFKRGRRTREAEQHYLRDVQHRMYLHSDGAPLYKCYDEASELITRIACLVHMRRPLFKLKDVSPDAGCIVAGMDSIFHLDRKIKEDYAGDAEEITRQRVIQIGPILNEIKQQLDMLKDALDPAKEPELLKAVNYALTEYPCIIKCLEDGSIDFSNNAAERQIRRIAKYRNNSFFVGSVKSGEDFARLQTVFANIRNHGLNAVEYLCDVFRRIGSTAKEDLVTLLAHRWQPLQATI